MTLWEMFTYFLFGHTARAMEIIIDDPMLVDDMLVSTDSEMSVVVSDTENEVTKFQSTE